MTDDSLFDLDKSRRSFMKEGALATGGLALGLSASTAAAQEDDGTETDSEGGSVRLYVSSFNPSAAFAIVSDSLDWTPQSVEGDVAVHMIRYLNSGQVVPAFFSSDANVGEYDADAGYVPAEGGAGMPAGDAAPEAGNETGLGDNVTQNESDLVGNDTETDTGGVFGGNETNETGGGAVGENETEMDGNETGGAATGAAGMPAVYEFGEDATLQQGGIVSVGFSTVAGSRAQTLLEGEDWWQGDGAAATDETETEAETGNETETETETETDAGLDDENDTDGAGVGPDDETGNETGNETGDGLFGDGDEGNESGPEPIFGGDDDATNATNDSVGNDTDNDTGL